MDFIATCINCKRDSNYPFENALRMRDLNTGQSVFTKAVADEFQVDRFLKSNSDKICVLCLQDLLKANPQLHQLITQSELEELEKSASQFRTDRLPGLYGKASLEK